ncbi:hypothetical protein THAOC_12245 [Thalassiosira oceanica]|uniref:Uncharacterized protein n=1 Tax=Thalassiosira oceanica TaxID=159749 RepID=K0SN58_THAOC|nr:hypothetical protein THAOC_12245 [Thalassiosira oceanica]|eukprot:EJK66795.1 hypothetical protein THAOC_12245 [Thalassiosira oceanica]
MPAPRRGSTYIGRHVSFGSGGSDDGDDDEAAEKLSLVFEILRLEKSMNNALTSARDEMEGLAATVSEKEAEAAALEGELEGLRRENESLGAAAGRRDGAPEEPQRSKSDSGAGGGRKQARRPSFAASFLPRAKSEGLFGRSFKAAKAAKQHPLKWDDSTQNTPATDASADSGSEFLPAAIAARLKPASSSRRASIDDPNDPHSVMERARFDQSGRSGGSTLSRRATLDVAMIENGCARLRAELSSREERLQELHGEKKANEERLRSLREEAAEGRVRSETRHDVHAARVEALQRRKCEVTGSVRDKERLLAEMEGSLREAEERAAKLEGQAEDGRARLHEMEQRRADERRREGGDGEPPSLATLEWDIRECRIRHAVHCSHMKAAVDSLRHVLVVDKADDPTGLLGRRRLADLTGEEREAVGAMVDEIAQDVDIQLSNMGRMMADMRDRMEELRRLSEPVAGGEEGRAEEGRQKGGGNELLALSRECAEVFGSFSDEVLRAVSSTSMSPASGGDSSARDAGAASTIANGGPGAPADDAFGGVRSILESIRRRREDADLVREREGVETKIAIVQGEIKRVQEAMEEENRLHEEVVRRLTSKIDALTEGLQGSRIAMSRCRDERGRALCRFQAIIWKESSRQMNGDRGLYRAGPTPPSSASLSGTTSCLSSQGRGAPRADSRVRGVWAGVSPPDT